MTETIKHKKHTTRKVITGLGMAAASALSMPALASASATHPNRVPGVASNAEAQKTANKLADAIINDVQYRGDVVRVGDENGKGLISVTKEVNAASVVPGHEASYQLGVVAPLSKEGTFRTGETQEVWVNVSDPANANLSDTIGLVKNSETGGWAVYGDYTDPRGTSSTAIEASTTPTTHEARLRRDQLGNVFTQIEQIVVNAADVEPPSTSYQPAFTQPRGTSPEELK